MRADFCRSLSPGIRNHHNKKQTNIIMKKYILIVAAAVVASIGATYASNAMTKVKDGSECGMGNKCNPCNGTGWTPGRQTKCFTCKGTGANSSY